MICPIAISSQERMAEWTAPHNPTKLWVGNLQTGLGPYSIVRVLQKHGHKVAHVKVFAGNSCSTDCCAFVVLDSEEAAASVIEGFHDAVVPELTGFEDKSLRVRYANPPRTEKNESGWSDSGWSGSGWNDWRDGRTSGWSSGDKWHDSTHWQSTPPVQEQASSSAIEVPADDEWPQVADKAWPCVEKETASEATENPKAAGYDWSEPFSPAEEEEWVPNTPPLSTLPKVRVAPKKRPVVMKGTVLLAPPAAAAPPPAAEASDESDHEVAKTDDYFVFEEEEDEDMQSVCSIKEEIEDDEMHAESVDHIIEAENDNYMQDLAMMAAEPLATSPVPAGFGFSGDVTPPWRKPPESSRPRKRVRNRRTF